MYVYKEFIVKIAFVVRQYHKRGGISKYVAELAEHLAKSNEVHVFAASWDDVNDTSIQFHKINMLSSDFLLHRKLIAWNNILEIGSFVLFSRFALRRKDFDIIHSQGKYWGNCDIYTAHSCHAASLKTLRQGCGFWQSLRKSILNPLHCILLLMEQYSIMHSKKIMTVSENVKEEILKYYKVDKHNIIAISLGVNLERFNPIHKETYRDIIRQRYNLKSDDRVILFPAHEFKRKGLFQLIHVCKTLIDKNLYVLVAGNDNPSQFKSLIIKLGLKERIIFTGPTLEMEKLLAASDFLVFPSAYEPFGLVVLEAMAAGLPVVVPKKVGASELITDHIDGILIENHDDIIELVHAVQSLIEIPTLSRSIGFNARKTAERYPWSVAAERTFQVYNEAIR